MTIKCNVTSINNYELIKYVKHNIKIIIRTVAYLRPVHSCRILKACVHVLHT